MNHTVPLFATPFTAVNTGASADFNARLAELCESERSSGGRDAARDPRYFRGREGFFESADRAAQELERVMLGHAVAVIAPLTHLSPTQFGALRVQTRAWCSIVQPDGSVPAQHFPDAAWLAIYCVQAGAPDSKAGGAGVLRLYERRLGSVYRDASTSALQAPYRYGNHAWSPAPGAMALFPAHVPHEVSVVRSDLPLVLVFAMIRFAEP
jgi:hypothetical protein